MSEGSSFWGGGFEEDLVAVINHFNDPEIVAIAHSGAIDPLRRALRFLSRDGKGASIRAAVIISPLARTGSFPALIRFLRPDGTGTTGARWLRFLGSNIFGLAWFMRNELAIRRVLLCDHSSMESVQRVWSQIDRCPFGRYLLSLARTFWPYGDEPFSAWGVEHALVMHAEYDRNFSTAQQRDTAKALGAEFQLLENGCHQWHADPHTREMVRERILGWFEAKGIAEGMGTEVAGAGVDG